MYKTAIVLTLFILVIILCRNFLRIAAIFLFFCSFLFSTFTIFSLYGSSMSPLYNEGDRVLAIRKSCLLYKLIDYIKKNKDGTECFVKIDIGDSSGEEKCMLKIIDHTKNIDDITHLYLRGMTFNSRDSRSFGYIPESMIVAVPVISLKKDYKLQASLFLKNIVPDFLVKIDNKIEGYTKR